MQNELTKATINLYAVLRNLEDLCDLDKEMSNLIEDVDITIKFVIKNGPQGYLSFKRGKCTFYKDFNKSDITLYFKSPLHFNQMMDGKANPIPLKGLTKIKFLKNEFITLTDKLSYYLKPTELLLRNKNYMKTNTILTTYTAFFALAQIGNNDPIGMLSANRIPNGTINISITESYTAIHLIIKDGHIEAKKGLAKNQRASMTFSDLITTNNILTGKVDTYSCIATEKLQLKGFIPMLDNMNKILALVSSYL
ncbi:MAG: SCP2 sterol-binding domain-containing protein [Vallitalea sp.]|nr:SCP2 sterol-binding domain-containing protein [Vallitalea sp.]